MNKDSVWSSLKEDKTLVYGRPIMDVFLLIVGDLEPRHIKDLDARQAGILNPEVKLKAAESVEEAAAAIKEGARDLYNAVGRAVPKGRLDLLKFLLDRGEELDAADAEPDFGSLLHVAMDAACEKGPEEIVRYLVKRAKSCRPGCVGEEGLLQAAALAGRKEVFEYLCDSGYDDSVPPYDLMGLAIRANSTRIAQKCLSGLDDDDLAEFMDFAHRKGRKKIADMIEKDLGWTNDPDQ